jgi:hypothetical protein
MIDLLIGGYSRLGSDRAASDARRRSSVHDCDGVCGHRPAI